MIENLPTITFATLALVLGWLIYADPTTIGDDNSFLLNFVNHELLAALGFITAVTLASAGSIHLELNKLQDETKNPFIHTRSRIRKSAYSLIIAFGFALTLVVTKPILPHCPLWPRALFNSAAILTIFWNLSVLLDLTRTVFHIPTVTVLKAINANTKASSSNGKIGRFHQRTPSNPRRRRKV